MSLQKHERHFAVPKSRFELKRTIPAYTFELPWLLGQLAQPERKAVREIVDNSDLIEVDGETYLVASVSPDTLDTLAAFDADAEDREFDLGDEVDDHGGDGSTGGGSEDHEPSILPANGLSYPCDTEEDRALPFPGDKKTMETITALKRSTFDGGKDWCETQRVKRMVGAS